MAKESEIESLRVSISGEAATILFADSTRAAEQLPTEVLYRSTLLQQAVSDGSEDCEVCLSLPIGCLDAWLEGLQAIDIQTGLPDEEPTSKVPRHLSRSVGHFVSLKAADFLGDKDAVTKLCRQAADMLFAPYVQSGLKQLYTEHEKGLHSLPSNLQRSVLASSRLPFLLQLSLLPETLHENALHAAFPTIAATSSLAVHCASLHDSELGNQYWKLLGRDTSLTSLKFTCSLRRGRTLSKDYISCMTKLTCLQSLCLSGLNIGNSSLHQLSSCLRSLIHLESLDLSDNWIRCVALRVDGQISQDSYSESVKQLAQAVSHLTALRSLDLSENPLNDGGALLMGPCIAELSHLKFLHMSSIVCTMVGSKQFLNHVSNCARLQSFRFRDNSGNFQSLESICSLSSLTCLHLPQLVRSEHDRRTDEDTEGYTNRTIKHISKLSSLQELRLPSMVHTSQLEEWKCLVACLPSLEALRVLSFPFHDSTPPSEFIAAVAETISELPCLQELQFGDENDLHMTLHGAPGTGIARCLSQGPMLQLISLCFGGNKAPLAQTLASSLKSITGLRSVDLSYCGMIDANFQAMSQLIDEVPYMRMLHFGPCDFAPEEECLCLAESFGKMGALESVSFDFHGESCGGLVCIVPECSNFRFLTKLSFCSTGIGGTLAALTPALGCLKCLVVLEFDTTYMADEGVVALAPAIGRLTALQCLSFPHNELSCDAVHALCAVMTTLMSLTYLDFERNYIAVEGARELARFARKLPVLNRLLLRHNKIEWDREVHGCSYVSMIAEGLDCQGMNW